jgi:hypothetical protein
MVSPFLSDLLEAVAGGKTSPQDALAQLADWPVENLGHAQVDHHRALRHGMPEVIFGQGKNPEQIAAIARSLLTKNPRVLITRVAPQTADVLRAEGLPAHAFATARCVVAGQEPLPEARGRVVVVAAGTADIPVAAEATLTARFGGAEVEEILDVGVAGIHRILRHRESLGQANAVIVVAGMEGALASVVGGLVGSPVIAVPTSIGYGAAFGGVAALLGMLNSCASNVTVVNIDNGFGAGYTASLINRRWVAAGRKEDLACRR